MNRDVAILAKMRTAQIPPYAYKSSLALEKQTAFSTIITEKEYDHGHGGMASFSVGLGEHSRRPVATVTKVCAVAAKELVLHNRKVYYTTISELAMTMRAYERGTVESFINVESLGKGYVVIGDFGESCARALLPAEWNEVQSVLLAHVARGGSCILGLTSPNIEYYMKIDMQLAVAGFKHITVE